MVELVKTASRQLQLVQEGVPRASQKVALAWSGPPRSEANMKGPAPGQLNLLGERYNPALGGSSFACTTSRLDNCSPTCVGYSREPDRNTSKIAADRQSLLSQQTLLDLLILE